MKNRKSIIYNLFIMCILLTVIGCNTSKIKVDKIIFGAKIWTVDSSMSIAEAMAIKDGKIIAIGSTKDLFNRYETDNEIKLDSGFIFPGLYDAHCHFLGYGISEIRYANLVGTKSFDEVLNRLTIFVNEHQKSQWILGRGWDQNDWEEKTFPNNSILNSIFPDIPVLLTRIDGHAVLVNDKALTLAGFTIDTKIPGGELIVENNRLTGVLLDNAADSLKDMVPELNEEELIEALMKAQKDCFAVGLTSVIDAGLGTTEIGVIEKLQIENKLIMNIYAMLAPTASNIDKYLKNGIYKSKNLQIQSVKLYADGALGSRGACLLMPYSDDTTNYGIIITNQSELDKWCKLIYDAGYQLNTHAIGDSAVRMVLNSYAKVLKGKNDRRWRIEHSQVVSPSDLHLFKDYSIIPAVNTTHATSDMYWAETRLGPIRIHNAYAYKNLLEQNGWLTNGSDFPIESINPLLSFYAAVARKDVHGYPGNGLMTDQALTREQALKAMTIWAAKGSFQEDQKGSLEVNKDADFVILNKDIMEIEINEIPNIQVINTWIKGNQVY